MSDVLVRPTSHGLLLTVDRWFQRLLVMGCWLYFAGVVGVWLLIRWAGDRWWLATFVMFAPRWVWLLPLLVVAPIALIRQQRLWTHIPLLLGATVVFFCVMDFRIPSSGWFSRSTPRFRVLTCNVEGGQGNRVALRELILRHQPDAVLLQECSDWDENEERVFPAGWHIRRAELLLIATPHPILQTHEHQRPSLPSPGTRINGLYCLIDGPLGPVGVCSVHLRTPREGLYTVLDRRTGLSPGRSGAVTEEIEWRRVESEALAAWLQGLDTPTVVAGDFNMPRESAIYRHHWADWGNAFDQAGWGFGATKTTRVRGIRYGLRIDHILADPKFHATGAWVIDPFPSDHLPLMADLTVRQ
jgi:vancomycin resistance protein VanJ